jgi:catechol 2,3-dioxygenase-like lactoylglutathione lyase family enzyme
MRIQTLLPLAIVAVAPLFGQLAPVKGNRGVTMGHLHLIVRDVDAQRKFWMDFGGKPVKNGMLDMIEFPGVYILLRKGEPTGGSVGSMVNHVGFDAQNSAEMAAKWQAAGIKLEKGRAAGQYYINTDDGLRIEILEDKTISTPLQFHHIHFNFTADAVPQAQAWYARMFDADPGMRGRYKSGDIAGANLTFADVKEAPAPTKGRTLDHIGFDVPDLDLTYRKMMLQGATFDEAPRVVNDGKTKVAFLTDPWGTRIELTQGLAPK